jgi:hypothetical protein
MAGGSLNISASRFTRLQGNAVAVENAGNVNISDIYMRGIGGHGITISGGSGERRLTGITGSDFRNRAINIDSPASAVTLNGIDIRDVFVPAPTALPKGSENWSNIQWIEWEWENGGLQRFGGGAIYINGGNVTVEAAVVNVSGGGTITHPLWNSMLLTITPAGISISGTAVTVSSSRVSGASGSGIFARGATIRVVGDTSVSNSGQTRLQGTGGGNIFVSNVTFDGSPFGIYGNTLATVSHVKVRNITGTISAINVGTNQTRMSNITVEDTVGTAISANDAGSNAVFELSNSVIRNTGTALNLNVLGANFTVTDVGFYNNRGNLFQTINASGTFLRCRFIHNSSMQRMEVAPPDPVFQRRDRSLFHTGSGLIVFDDCNFENLLGVSNWDTYLFSRWGNNALWRPLGLGMDGNNVELRNSRVTFRQGERVGLFAGFSAHLTFHGSPTPADLLLVDNVTIRNNGSTLPLFCLTGNSPAGSFHFRPNNVYYAPSGARVPLSTAGDFTGLGSGVVRLQQNAVPRVAW